MKKYLRNFTYFFLILIFTLYIFTNSSLVNNAINTSFKIFYLNIFPSLFPMFLISSMLTSIKIPEFLSSFTSGLFRKIFLIKDQSIVVFFMGLITGYPSCAIYINDLMKNNLLNSKDVSKILCFSFFSNPLFIINTVGIMFFNDKRLGYLILISHILSNILLGILLRKYKTPIIRDNNNKVYFKDILDNINNTNLFTVITNSIKTSLKSLINIFGIVTFFLIIISLINNYLFLNEYLNIFVSGLLEMTTGLKLVCLSSLNYNLKLIFSMFFICFGGFSIHAQIFNIIKKDVKYKPFLISRVIHGILGVIILLILNAIIL